MKITYKEVANELALMDSEDYYAAERYRQIHFEVRAKKFIRAANAALRRKLAPKEDSSTFLLNGINHE